MNNTREWNPAEKKWLYSLTIEELLQLKMLMAGTLPEAEKDNIARKLSRSYKRLVR